MSTTFYDVVDQSNQPVNSAVKMICNPDVSSILQDPIFKPSLRKRIDEVRQYNEDAQEFLSDVVAGVHRAAIIYGPPGMGKTHAVVEALKLTGLQENKDYVVARSHATPGMLYVLLHMMRKAGKFVILDDCDGIIANETGLNLLKGATDPTYRQVGWASTQQIKNPITGKPLPDTFDFNGTVIICTNVRFASGKGRIANHMDALRSRSAPFSLALDSREDQYAQIFHMIVNKDYLNTDIDTQLSEMQKVDLLKFLLDNLDVPRRLDLRLPQHIARAIKAKPDNWQRQARRFLDAA
jgi:Cdc6-like AAA superfamily ATPase